MIPVVITDDADADILKIGDHIAADNPRRAASFMMELRDKALNVGTAPRAYPARSDLGPNLRMAVHGQYLILFRILPKQVEVLRIFHGARDLPRALDE